MHLIDLGSRFAEYGPFSWSYGNEKGQHTPATKIAGGLASDSSVHVSPLRNISVPQLASHRARCFANGGEAFTYFLTCPSSRVWGGSVNKLESGVLAGTYRPVSSQTQLNDALIESYTGRNQELFHCVLRSLLPEQVLNHPVAEEKGKSTG